LVNEPVFFFRGVAGVLVIYAAVNDWRTFEMPFSFTISAAVIAVFGEGLFGSGWLLACAGSAAGFGLLKLAQLIARWSHKKECLGSGDAVLMLSLGALVGLEGLPWALALATGFAFLTLKLLQKEKLPFGPFLVTASLAVTVVQWSG
jgi:prepilin signal peptidase PulO-like enzyme (type II secretory pathway)